MCLHLSKPDPSEPASSRGPATTLVGLGALGRVLVRLLSPHTDLSVWDIDPQVLAAPLPPGVRRLQAPSGIAEADTVIYAVPMNRFQATVESHRPFLHPGQLVIDTLSVKTLPARVLEGLLPLPGPDLLLTHPLFGPQSFPPAPGAPQPTVVVHPLRIPPPRYALWKTLLGTLGLRTTEVPPLRHDYLMARGQAITHLVGQWLKPGLFTASELDPGSTRALHHICDLCAQEAPHLWADLWTCNPWGALVWNQLNKAFPCWPEQTP